jgi:hypothetical protein
MRKILFAMSLFTSVCALAAPTDYLTSFKIDLYKMAVSENPNCTGLLTVIDNGNNPKSVDLYNNPQFGKATILEGTYRCFVLEISSTMKMVPGPANNFGGGAGNCAIGTEVNLPLSGSGINTKLIGESSTGAITTKMAIYLTTDTTASGNTSTAFLPPNGSGRGVNIANPLVLTANAASYFNVSFGDITTAVDNSNAGECGFNDMKFNFVNP